MGYFARVSSVVSPARVRAENWGVLDDRWYVPAPWLGALTAAGMRVSPDLALTLSAVWRAVSTIAGDISSLPCQLYRRRDDDGKDRARAHPLSYLLRWQPNDSQTAQQFWSFIVGSQQLRGNGYAEIVAGPRGPVDQLIPRHPDRVQLERLPSGRKRFRLLRGNPDGTDRYLTQDEMAHFPDVVTFDGLGGASRIAYGMQSFGGMLAAERAAHTFFSTGMTASVVATHKGGELDEDELKSVHQSLTLYAGAKNNGGILIVEDDISIQNLSIDPEKAQLLETRKNSVKDVARWFGVPGHKLETDQQTQAYAARVQANLEYVIGTLRPILVGLEQVIQKDLIVAKDLYFSEFLLEALLRGDEAARAAYYKDAIRNRWMNPNEVRSKENMNAYEGGDEYCPWNTASAADNGSAQRGADGPDRNARAMARAAVLGYETGLRIVRKERNAVEKAAKQFAGGVSGWQAWLRDFYADHARYVAQTIKVPVSQAREYAAERGTLLEKQGIVVFSDDNDAAVAAELGVWALEGRAA